MVIDISILVWNKAALLLLYLQEQEIIGPYREEIKVPFSTSTKWMGVDWKVEFVAFKLNELSLWIDGLKLKKPWYMYIYIKNYFFFHFVYVYKNDNFILVWKDNTTPNQLATLLPNYKFNIYLNRMKSVKIKC